MTKNIVYDWNCQLYLSDTQITAPVGFKFKPNPGTLPTSRHDYLSTAGSREVLPDNDQASPFPINIHNNTLRMDTHSPCPPCTSLSSLCSWLVLLWGAYSTGCIQSCSAFPCFSSCGGTIRRMRRTSRAKMGPRSRPWCFSRRCSSSWLLHWYATALFSAGADSHSLALVINRVSYLRCFCVLPARDCGRGIPCRPETANPSHS